MLSILEAIGQKGVITSEDVLALRAAMYGDNLISHPEAEAIIAMAHSGAQGDKTWQAFFLEALTDFVVRQSDPPGYVNAEVAGWLTSQLLSEGRPRSALSLELIVHILETAVESPDSLKEAILKAIEFSVMDGIHPGSEPLKAPNPRITDPEVGLLRRVLYAAGGDGAATISTDEADLLFRLKDATLGAENGPSWKDFFVKAIANHLMAHNFHTAISRDEALGKPYSKKTRTPGLKIMARHALPMMKRSQPLSRLGCGFRQTMTGNWMIWKKPCSPLLRSVRPAPRVAVFLQKPPSFANPYKIVRAG